MAPSTHGGELESALVSSKAWANWFSATFLELSVPIHVGVSGNILVVTIHTLRRIAMDRRVLSLTPG